jgi:hypothetical protein
MPEERKWFESGLFYQQKQWLERSTENKRKLVPIWLRSVASLLS